MRDYIEWIDYIHEKEATEAEDTGNSFVVLCDVLCDVLWNPSNDTVTLFFHEK